MTIPNGSFELNEAQAIFRGHFLAATGTFSGRFASDVINVVDNINLRDGAVISWHSALFEGLTWEMTLPAMGGPFFLGFYCSLFGCGDGIAGVAAPRFRAYQDDVLIEDYIYPHSLGISFYAFDGGVAAQTWYWDTIPIMWGHVVSHSSPVTYRFEFSGGELRTRGDDLPYGWRSDFPVEFPPEQPGYGSIIIWKR